MNVRRPHSLLAGFLLCVLVNAGCGLHADTQRELANQGGGQQAAGGTGTVDANGNPLQAGAAGGAVSGSAGGVAGPDGAVAGPATGTGAGSTGAGTTTTGSGTVGTTTGTGTTSGSTTRTHLFTDAENKIGITADKITMCVHAALTYGQAFQTTDADYNVHWNEVNSKGGIFGRKVEVTYENDNYTASDAVVAAQACADKNPFVLLGGIGYDQIPAVRNFAEKHHILYLHHSAPAKGSQGLKYSFSALPTVERMGDAFAALTGKRFHGKKVGIIGRDSANWEPGTAAYRAGEKKYGFTIVAESKVAPSKGNYTDDILNMKNHGAEVVFTWDNALDNTQIIKQAKAQAYNPNWVVFGVNLLSQTLGEDAMNPPLVGAAMNAAYSYGDYSGVFAQYADDMKQFEAEYKKWRPNTDLTGVGGDLLFMNWASQRGMEVLLRKCGKDCNRNAFVDTFTSFTGKTSSSGCPTDFSGDGHHGSVYADFIETYRAPGGKVNFRPIQHCVRP